MRRGRTVGVKRLDFQGFRREVSGSRSRLPSPSNLVFHRLAWILSHYSVPQSPPPKNCHFRARAEPSQEVEEAIHMNVGGTRRRPIAQFAPIPTWHHSGGDGSHRSHGYHAPAVPTMGITRRSDSGDANHRASACHQRQRRRRWKPSWISLTLATRRERGDNKKRQTKLLCRKGVASRLQVCAGAPGIQLITRF